MKKLRIHLLLALLACTVVNAAFPTLYLNNVCDDQLHAPTNICNAGDGSKRLFICDQPGKIFIFQNGMLLPTPFLDLTATGANKIIPAPAPPSYSERGLLGMCFHPGFADPMSPGHGRFYVNYTAPSTLLAANPVQGGATTNCVTVIAEYQVSATNPNAADPNSERVLLTYGQPQSNHNGGQLEFGPDGFLYIASGDGGGANDNAIGHTGGTTPTSPGRVSATLGNGQDTTVLLGKVLRIDPLGSNGQGGQYGIPPGNPFFNGSEAHGDDPEREEIYAWGLRNPWRFSFDASFGGTNSLICADVGQLDVEEIDLIVNGGNYGWRMKEGTADFDNTAPAGPGAPIPPIAHYTHPSPTLLPATTVVGTSITGGYVYRGSTMPSLFGKYLFADYAVEGINTGNGIFLGLEEAGPGTFILSQVSTTTPLPAGSRIYCFGRDEAGELYVATKTTAGVLALDNSKPAGTIWKLMISGTAVLTADKDNSMFEGTNNSNGSGVHLYVGKTGDAGNYLLRRGLIHFNLGALPPDGIITNATLQLNVNLQNSQDINFSLHRLTSDWGEGASVASAIRGGEGVQALSNDTTWLHRFYSTLLWTAPGGDFVANPSAVTSVGNRFTAPYPSWSGAGLIADINAWRATPSINFGWMLRGDEATPYTAMRFSSRESTNSADRPRLTISYASSLPDRFESWRSAHYPAMPPGFYVAAEGDDDGDGMANLVEYAFGYDPTVRTSPHGLQVYSSVNTLNGNTDTTITFRRDPRATDLTYVLEASYNLTAWQNITSSANGATASGSAFFSDSLIPGETPLRLVTAVESNPAGSESALRRYVRLRISKVP